MEPEETPLKQIRTFQGDVAEVLQRERGSLVSIQRAEHLKKNPLHDTSSENYKNKSESFFLLVGSLLLFTLGMVGVWYAYNAFIKGGATPVTTASANRFIPVDAEINLNFTVTSREALIDILSGAVMDGASKELRHFVFTKEGTSKPSYLLRNLPIDSVFTDIVDKNKDIRILMFNDQTVLLYSFFDNNKLIITDNIDTLRILVDRLIQEKLPR